MNDNEFYKQPTLPIPPVSEKVSAPIALPKMIGPYKIESLLNKGGMSLLYLGTRPDTHEPTAIKVLPTKFLSNSDTVERFLKEANIIAMTDHPNIIKLYGNGEWEGGLYIAMEFIQGISLRQFILQTPISLKRALEIIIDIAYALCHLHMHGVIHRDLKPENILVTDSGAIKVIDFGIAQLLSENMEMDPSQRKRLIGTPVYMSPEQRENPESVSYPSDIYSLGIIAYELVLGKLCHGQIHLSMMPKGMQKILAKALQPNPEDRYHDVVDLIADLTAYLHSAAWKDEQKVGDHLSELSENLQRAQQIYFTAETPLWPGFQIGLASYKSSETESLYHDFLRTPSDNFLVLMGKSSTQAAEGIVHTASIKGMIKALSHMKMTSIEMMTTLKELILHEGSQLEFMLGYLLLNNSAEIFEYISCGYGSLWHLKKGASHAIRILSNNPSFGKEPIMQFSAQENSWSEGNILVLMSCSENDFLEEEIKNALSESSQFPPQQLAESLLRKFRLLMSKSGKHQSIDIICVKRQL